jgi:hypothetical protein
MSHTDLAAVAVPAFAGIGFGLHGVALWSAVFLHAMMTVWCVACLRRSPLNVTTDSNLRKQFKHGKKATLTAAAICQDRPRLRLT